MAGEFLPPVVTVLEADVSDVAAKVEEAKALIASLGDVKIPVGFDINDAAFAELKADAQSLASSVGRISLPVDSDLNAASLLASAAAARGLTSAINGLTSGTDNASNSMRILGTGIRVNALGFHILLASAIDFAAIAGPALVAAGAWAADWMQGAGMVYQHMTALYDATESLGQAAGKTFGEELGLRDALQAAQNAANPQVYQAMGGAINLLKEQFGDLAQTGLQVGSIFDTFMAHLDQDFSTTGSAGKTMDGLLSGMVPDLVGLGQVIGNVGHAVGLLADDMPGFAHVLLGFLDVVTGGITTFLNFGHATQYLVTGFFALHEVSTWGTALVNIFGKMGIASSELSGNFMGLERPIGVLRNLIGVLPQIGFQAATAASKIPMIGTALVGTTAEVEQSQKAFTEWLGNLSNWEVLGIAAAAAGVGFLAYKMITAKDAAQQFASSLQNDISNAGNLTVLNSITAGIDTLEEKLQQLPKMVMNGRLGFVDNPEIGQMQSAIQSLNSQFTGIIAHANQVGQAFGTTMVGGMALAQAAGVNLDKTLTSSAWAVAYQQIQNYVTGMKAMGESTGQVGTDMTALAISEGLQSSKVQQVSQAWDQFMSNLTGGTADLASAVTSLSQIGNVVGKVTNNLGQASSISLTTQQFAQALNTAGTEGAQAWTNFDQVLGSTFPQLIDWLRTAQTEGAVTGTSFSKDVLDMAASLVPFAEKSKTAQAEVMGLAQESGIQGLTFQQLVADYKSGKFSLDDLTSSVDQATIKMANMNQVAQQLGNVVQTDFINQVGQAIITSKTMTGQIQNLISKVQQFGANSPQAVSALHNIRQALIDAGIHGQELKQIMQGLQQYIDTMHGTTLTIGVNEEMSYVMGKGANPAGPPGFAAGSRAARPGWAWVGERGPELMHLRGGERIIPNHRLNGYADGAGSGGDTILHNHVYLNGREIYSEIKRMSYDDNFANGNRLSGGRPTGVLRPR